MTNEIGNSIGGLTKVLNRVPEVKKACVWMRNNPDSYTDIAKEYLELMATMDKFSNEDLIVIKNAREIMKKENAEKTSASHINTNDFISAISGRVSLEKLAREAFNASSPYYQKAIAQLGDMMFNGHEMFSSGGVPVDGDPRSDSVIWGHTQAKKDVSPSVLVHFIISHFLARFFSYALAEFDILKEKDDFFTPMTSALLLSEAKNEGGTIFKPWMTSREKGGLNWTTKDQLNAYREALRKKKVIKH